MAETFDNEEVVSYKDALIGQMIHLDTITRLLIEKRIITEEEFFTKLKQVQQEYERRKAVEE